MNAIGVVAIGPLNCFFDDQYTRLFLSGVARACEARGAGISLVSASDDEIAAWNIRTALVDGFILHCLNEGNTLVELAEKRGLPFVAVDFPVGPGLDVVKIDDYRGAREAAQHLVDLGHKHFAVFTFETGRKSASVSSTIFVPSGHPSAVACAAACPVIATSSRRLGCRLSRSSRRGPITKASAPASMRCSRRSSGYDCFRLYFG